MLAQSRGSPPLRGWDAVRTSEPGKRQRVLDAHRVAEEFYCKQLAARRPTGARSRLSAASTRRCVSISGRICPGLVGFVYRAQAPRLHGSGDPDRGPGVAGSRGIYDRFRGPTGVADPRYYGCDGGVWRADWTTPQGSRPRIPE